MDYRVIQVPQNTWHLITRLGQLGRLVKTVWEPKRCREPGLWLSGGNLERRRSLVGERGRTGRKAEQ